MNEKSTEAIGLIPPYPLKMFIMSEDGNKYEM